MVGFCIAAVSAHHHYYRRNRPCARSKDSALAHRTCHVMQCLDGWSFGHSRGSHMRGTFAACAQRRAERCTSRNPGTKTCRHSQTVSGSCHARKMRSRACLWRRCCMFWCWLCIFCMSFVQARLDTRQEHTACSLLCLVKHGNILERIHTGNSPRSTAGALGHCQGCRRTGVQGGC